MTTVSVIIPTRDRPTSLSKAIRSVLAQTEKRLEIFVVDDASPNAAAAEVVRECGDDRLRYIRLSSPGGPGAARNVALMRATSPYVAFLDDDDEWLPGKLEAQVSVLEQSDPSIGLVHTARITVDEIAGVTSTTSSTGHFDPCGRNVITTSTVLMKRECFATVGFFDEDLYVGEDFDMWLRVSNAYRFSYIDQPLVKYFVHSGYRLSKDDSRIVSSHERLLRKHRKIFEANKRELSRAYAALALTHGRLGDTANGVRAWARAMRLYPFQVRLYWTLLRLVASAVAAPRPWGTSSGAMSGTERS